MCFPNRHQSSISLYAMVRMLMVHPASVHRHSLGALLTSTAQTLSHRSYVAAAGKKKTLNVGRSGGSAGLDDYKFDDALDDDDFM